MSPSDVSAIVFSRQTLVPVGLGAAVALGLAGGAYTFATDKSEARAERQATTEAVKRLATAIENAGLSALPDRIERIEQDIASIKTDRFTSKDAEILKYQLREKGIVIPVRGDNP